MNYLLYLRIHEDYCFFPRERQKIHFVQRLQDNNMPVKKANKKIQLTVTMKMSSLSALLRSPGTEI